MMCYELPLGVLFLGTDVHSTHSSRVSWKKYGEKEICKLASHIYESF